MLPLLCFKDGTVFNLNLCFLQNFLYAVALLVLDLFSFSTLLLNEFSNILVMHLPKQTIYKIRLSFSSIDENAQTL